MGRKAKPETVVELDADQPATCPHCGTRTEFAERKDGMQDHRCPSCRRTFIGHVPESKPRCSDAKCLGWAIVNGEELQRCDECARFDSDDSARLAALRWSYAVLQRPIARPDFSRALEVIEAVIAHEELMLAGTP